MRNHPATIAQVVRDGPFLGLLALFALHAAAAPWALANAVPVVMTDLVLAALVLAGLVLDRREQPAARRVRARVLVALLAMAGIAGEVQLLYPRFVVIDFWMGTLLGLGHVAVIVSSTLTLRIGRAWRIGAAAAAVLASAALFGPATDSIMLATVVPPVVSIAALLPIHLIHHLQRLQREAIESQRKRVALSEKLAMASAEILDSRHRESLSLISAGISHEINNPLTYLRGNVELLREALDPVPEQTRGLIDGIESGVTAIARVVDRIRTIFRGTAGPPQAVDLHETVSTALASVSLAADGFVAISNRVARDLVVNAHPADVYIVAANLIRNAVEAAGRGAVGQVTVSAEVVDGHVSLLVRDTGPGMGAEEIGRCFDPFYTTKHEQGGMGVGLALCKAIADRTGDALEIESEPGAGTTARYRMKRSCE